MVGSTYDGSAGGQSTPGSPVVHGPRSSSEKHNEPQRTNTSHEHPRCGHGCAAELLRADPERLHPDRPVPALLARADRRLHRRRLRLARHETPRVGVAGRHHRQHHALLRLRRRRARSRGPAHPPVRPVRPAGLLHHRQHLRLDPLGAAPTCDGRRQRRPRDRAPLDAPARTDRAGRRLAGRHRHRPPGLRGPVGGLAEPLLHAAVVVLLVRRVDLRRLDRRDLRDGARLERVLAGVDRRRPGRRPARLRHRLRADRHHVHLLRHVRALRLHPVGEGDARRVGQSRPRVLEQPAPVA